MVVPKSDRDEQGRQVGAAAATSEPIAKRDAGKGTGTGGVEERLEEAQARLRTEQAARAEAERELGRLHDETMRLKASLDHVSRELESLSYSISHDLRAPVRHMIGFSNALQEDFGEKLESTAHSYLECIIRAGRKMENLVEALLGLSRIGRQEMTLLNLDLSQMATSFVATLREAEPARKVEFRIQEHLHAHGDAVLMRAVLEQLLGNAWKFTARKDPAIIEVGSLEEGGERVFFVRDNGVGFDMRFADRLFSPFQRMHREEDFPGIGVGLATVQRIVHRHGGRVWAEAQPDAGASFYFTIPS